MFTIIDRRKNPHGKSLGNTQRFSARVKTEIKNFVDKMADKTNIQDLGNGSNTIEIKQTNKIHEPHFQFARESYGTLPWILPGNPKEVAEITAYNVNDLIPKPPSGGKGNNGSPREGIDDYHFVLGPDEFFNILFEDCELPNIEEKTVSEVETTAWNKKGFRTSGSPANIARKRTLSNSFSRRIALNRPKDEEIQNIKNQLEISDEGQQKEEFIKLLEDMERRKRAIPYIDPIDVRFHNLEQQPKPIFNAVMFCLMDVSGSMTEQMKDLAKRFYIILYRFLKTKYEKVDVVFVRHTHIAQIVDEETFFYDPNTGGTIVSVGLEKVLEKIDQSYDPRLWNVYLAQASDGDNWFDDNKNLIVIEEKLMHKLSYHFYVEIERTFNAYFSMENFSKTELWKVFETVQQNYPKKFSMRKLNERKHVYPVFREFFARK